MSEPSDLTVPKEQEAVENDKPPSNLPRPARPWRVAVIANVKGESSLPIDAPADAGAEFDRIETIEAIMHSIESEGHSAFLLPADTNLPYTLRETRPDLCFNIAEGLTGDSREAQVPALLEMLQIPYTASRVLANAIGLDKTMTKRLWRQHGLPTADFQEFNTGYELLSRSLCFPMFVKPAREGTGMGMDEGAIVQGEAELRRRIRWVIEEYRQPALVEEYLPGREFTVAVMGRQDAALFAHRPELYRRDGFHRFPVLEVESAYSVTPGVYGHAAKTKNYGDEGMPAIYCPANIEPALAEHLNNLAIRGHQAIGALDISRIDFRLSADGKPRMLEINTLPGMTPDFSDLCVIANADGISYRELVLEILYLGASRFGMLPARQSLMARPARAERRQQVGKLAPVAIGQTA
jgi:D-alanine-D-alanine ligase